MIAQPQDFRAAVWTIAYSYFFKAELLFSLLLVLLVGPNLVSRDLRFNALPLYFSRPLRRIDYFLGKLGVIGFFLAATVVVPAVVAYLLGVAFSLDLGVVRDTHRLLVGAASCTAGHHPLGRHADAGAVVAVAAVDLRRPGLGGVRLPEPHAQRRVLIGINADTERQSDRSARGSPSGCETTRRRRASRCAGRTRSCGTPRRAARRRVCPPEAGPRGTAKEQWMRRVVRRDGRTEHRGRGRPRRAQLHRLAAALSYATNLDRIGDWLLDTDAAWVTLGRTLERPRALSRWSARSPRVGSVRTAPAAPANDRVLADRMVWQFPWYWSAGVLGGLWLLSAFVLSSRVKSLDRLK